MCWLRFVAYIELGKQKETFQGKERVREKCLMTFELSGPNHQPKVLDDGTKLPHRITIEETLSQNEKANFFKLFTVMNYAGKAQHVASLLGEAYMGEVVHRTYKGRDGKDRVAVDLKVKGAGYTIKPPRYADPMTGEIKVIPVPAPITPIKAFMWNYADMDQWKDVYIDGEYPEVKNEKGEVTKPAKSKNVYQARIMQAVNFIGSPMHELLVAGGAKLDIPDAEDPSHAPADEGEDPTLQVPGQQAATPSGTAATDALNGIV
jgi:hypothetical protein